MAYSSPDTSLHFLSQHDQLLHSMVSGSVCVFFLFFFFFLSSFQPHLYYRIIGKEEKILHLGSVAVGVRAYIHNHVLFLHAK